MTRFWYYLLIFLIPIVGFKISFLFFFNNHITPDPMPIIVLIFLIFFSISYFINKKNFISKTNKQNTDSDLKKQIKELENWDFTLKENIKNPIKITIWSFIFICIVLWTIILIPLSLWLLFYLWLSSKPTIRWNNIEYIIIIWIIFYFYLWHILLKHGESIFVKK